MKKGILHKINSVQFVAICVFFFTQSIFTFAAQDDSKLQLSLWNNKPLYVQIDGDYYQGNQYITVEGLAGGVHRLRVFGSSAKPKGNKGKVLLYEGKINIPEHTVVTSIINRQMWYEVVSETPLRTCGNEKPHVVQIRPVNTGCQKPAPNVCEHHDNYDQDCDEPDTYVEVWPEFTDHDLEQFLATLDNVWNDDDKLIVASQALQGKSITTDRTMEIASRFWYEKNKLEFLKRAYSNVIDKSNYYKVNELFLYSSSIQELDKYIRERQNFSL
jgi:Domain of unknown function (DUF4476)